MRAGLGFERCTVEESNWRMILGMTAFWVAILGWGSGIHFRLWMFYHHWNDDINNHLLKILHKEM